MFSVYLPNALVNIARKRTIKADDLPIIDEIVHADVAMMNDEIEWMSYLDRACLAKEAAWFEFYVNTTVDYVVNITDTPGVVESDRLSWLLECLCDNGMIASSAGLEILLRIGEAAELVPEWMAPFALNQVRAGIAFGLGPLGAGINRETASVLASDVQVMRRILTGTKSVANAPLSRLEIDILFDVNEQSDQATNDPAWSDLFVKAAADFMIAGRYHNVPERSVALAPADWLDHPVTGTAHIFRRLSIGLLPHSLEEFWREYRRDEARGELASEGTGEGHSGEISWVLDRLSRSGELRDNEKELLTFLSLETPDLHPSLRTLIDAAA